MNIFFDLDGTLIDSRLRLYKLFQHLVPENILSFEEYWNLKRNKESHYSILSRVFNYPEKRINNFEKDWMVLIEDIRFLEFDSLFPYTLRVLKKLSKTHQLYIITARQSREAVMLQLLNLGISKHFKEILVTEAKKSKTELLRDSVEQISREDILVGDTGLDVQTAEKIGCRSLAVLSGFRNRSVLLEYKPDYIENNIQSIVKYV